MHVQRDYVQAEKEYAVKDEKLTHSYTHNIEVQTSQQDRAQHYKRSESAKQAKVTCAHSQKYPFPDRALITVLRSIWRF